MIEKRINWNERAAKELKRVRDRKRDIRIRLYEIGLELQMVDVRSDEYQVLIDERLRLNAELAQLG